MNEIRITIEGLAELTAAINRLAGQSSAAAQNTVPAQNTAPVQGNMQGQYAPPVNPAQYQQAAPAVPQQPPVQTGAMPGQMPASTVPTAPTVPVTQSAAPTQVPTTTNVQGYTIEQLQVAAAGLMSAGKGQQVMGILQQFGIQAMTELPKERYGEFATVLREAGAQI